MADVGADVTEDEVRLALSQGLEEVERADLVGAELVDERVEVDPGWPGYVTPKNGSTNS